MSTYLFLSHLFVDSQERTESQENQQQQQKRFIISIIVYQ